MSPVKDFDIEKYHKSNFISPYDRLRYNGSRPKKYVQEETSDGEFTTVPRGTSELWEDRFSASDMHDEFERMLDY